MGYANRTPAPLLSISEIKNTQPGKFQVSWANEEEGKVKEKGRKKLARAGCGLLAPHGWLKMWNKRINAGHHRDDFCQHRVNATNYCNDLLQHRMNAKNYRDDLLEHRMNAKNYRDDLLQHRMNAKNYCDDLLQHRINATSYCNDLSELGNDGPYPNYLIGCPNMAAKKRGVCPKMGFWRQAKNVNRPCKPVIRP